MADKWQKRWEHLDCRSLHGHKVSGDGVYRCRVCGRISPRPEELCPKSWGRQGYPCLRGLNR
jgi:hypothetical protein